MAPHSPNPFDKLPIETNQYIASFLEYDSDLCHFRLICRSTLDAIDADNCSFWRRRFLTHFEEPSSSQPTSNVKFRSAYQGRKFLLKNGAIFGTGDTGREKRCLEMMVSLVVDSFSEKTGAKRDILQASKNLVHIRRFLRANNLLQIIFRSSSMRYRGISPQHHSRPSAPTSLLTTIQVLCAPMLLSFEPHLMHHHYGFPESQRVVYSDTATQPIFGGYHGLDINMPFLLHNINFWKYHMMREAEGTLYYPFFELDEDEKPRWWSSQPKQSEQKLGKHWKGSYAFINRDEIADMRRGVGENEQEIQDRFAGEDAAFSFQDIKLEIAEAGHEWAWPAAFEKHLHSLSPPPPSGAKTRAQMRASSPEDVEKFARRSFRFDGEGNDVSEPFLAAGWLNPLPKQQRIPGWHRMTMMKYFEDDFGGIEQESLWAYEGVALPGGQIMLGRWWCVGDGSEEMYSGPFILFCVDGPKYDAIDAATSVTEAAEDGPFGGCE